MPYKEVPRFTVTPPEDFTPPPVGPYNPEYVPPGETVAPWATPTAEEIAIPGSQPYAPIAQDIANRELEDFVNQSDWGDQLTVWTATSKSIGTEIIDVTAEIARLTPGMVSPIESLSNKIQYLSTPLTVDKVGEIIPYGLGKVMDFIQDPLNAQQTKDIQALKHYAEVELPTKQTIAAAYIKLYSSVSHMIEIGFDPELRDKLTDNKFDTVEEVMEYIDQLAHMEGFDSFSEEDLAALKSAIQEVIDYYSTGGGIGKVAPQDMEYAPLEAPEQPTSPRPVSLHQLTTQEILDSMAFVPAPDTTFTQAEWDTYLKDQELYSQEDLDNWYILQVEEFVADWKETVDNLASYRKGMAEMPEYTWSDMLRTAFTQPTLAALDIAGHYFRYVSQPLAGIVWGAAFPKIQTAYNRLTDPSTSTFDRWMAYGEAWEGWDAPGDGTGSWMLKYLVMEGMVDPLSYIGFGLATKATRPFGAFGRAIKWTEESFNLIGDVPIDIIKGGLAKVPKTAGQRYVLYGAGALKNKGKVEEMYFPANRWKDLTKEETVHVAQESIAHFRNNPMATDRVARYGRDLLIIQDLDESALTKLITGLDKKAGGTARTPEEIALFLTKNKVADMQEAFEVNFLFRSKGHRLLPEEEAAAIIRRVLDISPVDHEAYKAVDDAIVAFLDARADNIVNGATSIFGGSNSALRGAAEWNEQIFRYLSDAEQSATALSMKDKGVWGKRLAQVPIDVQRVWVNYIDRHLVKTFAEAYLTFGMYGPMNTFEDIFRSLLSGVNPHRMQVDDWMTLSHGLEVDPATWLHAGISELYGPFKAYGVGPDWSNWLLQGFGLWAGAGERLYKYGVRWPGALSQDFRRNALAGYFAKFLREEAPEALEQLGRIVGKGPNIGNKDLAREVGEYLAKAATTGDSTLARSVSNIFTRHSLRKKEIIGILDKHPNLPGEARDMIMERFTAGELDSPQGIQNAIADVEKYVAERALQSPEAIAREVDSLMEQLMKSPVESTGYLNQIFQATHHALSVDSQAVPNYLGALTELTRGMSIADRTLRFDKGFDDLIKMISDTGGSVDPVLDKLTKVLRDPERINKVDWPKVKWTVAPSYRVSGVKGKFTITDAMKAELQEVIDSLPLDIKFDLKGIRIDEAACKAQPYSIYGAAAFYDTRTKKIVIRNDWAGGMTARQREDIYHEMGHAVMDKRWPSGEGIQLMQDFVNEVAGNVRIATRMKVWWSKTFEPGYKMKVRVKNPKTGKMEAVELTGAQVRKNMSVHSSSTDRTALLEDINYRDWHEVFTSQFEAYCAMPEDVTAKAFLARLQQDQVGVEFMISAQNIGGAAGMAERSLTFFRKNFPRSQKVAHLSPVNRDAYTNLHDLLTLTKLHGDRFGLDNIASRKEWFANKPPRAGDAWWQSFYRDMYAQVHQFKAGQLRLWGDVLRASRKIDNIANPGVDRAPMIIEGALSPQDIANLLGVRTEDISSHLMDAMIVHGDRDYFVEYVLGHVLEGDVGFTRESIGAAYDQILQTLKVSDNTIDWMTGVKKETQAVRGELHDLCLQGSHPQIDLDNVAAWGNEVGDAMDELMYKGVALADEGIPVVAGVEGAVPPTAPRVPTEAFSDFQAARQRAMDRAHKQYYKEFPDYTHANAADAAMKTIYPFWTYESNRWLYLPRLFMQKPGVFAQMMRYQDHSDNGYIPLYGDVQFNPFRGTVFGTMSTRLFRRDYPEYYDRLGPVVGFGLEAMDYFSRFGFYPGVHISAPISLLGGLSPQTGEILPSIVRTPLSLLMAAFPDSEAVKLLTDTIFPERYREYMTSLQATKYGGDGQLILAKIRDDRELTEEEQAIWTQARQYTGLYSAIAEQFGLFRMRPQEKIEVREAAFEVIHDMTGFSKDQQIWMERHGYRIWDVIGGLSPENQAILEEMDYYKWSGHGKALLPSRQQIILDRNTLDWDEVNRFVDSQDVTRQQLQDEFMSGSIGPRAYNDEMATMFMETGNMIDQKQLENPYMTHDGKIDYYNEFGIPMPVDHPMKELLRLYHAVKLERLEDKETGEMMYDWDRFFAHRQIVIDSLPDHLRGEWEAEIQKNMTDIEMIRHDVYNTYFRKYYDVADITREQFPENEAAMITEYYSLNRRQLNLDRQAQIKAHISVLTGLQLISSYSSNLSDNRRALRYKNPHLDAWLFYWGRTDSFLTDSAESMFPTIAQQTGRSIIK